MKLSLICFTESGAHLSAELMKELLLHGHECCGFVPEKFFGPVYEAGGLKPLNKSLGEWTREQFGTCEGLIFIGAAGIAVRAIAPWVRDKRTDPAVVVIDDMGHFSISLLSGHLGGANRLAEETAEITGGVPVITTATDIHGRFAVDSFAKEQGMWISDMKAAKAVSADILAGEPVGFFCDFLAEGAEPKGLIRNVKGRRNVWITVKREPRLPDSGEEQKPYLSGDWEVLRLVPRIVILGIGCKKGTKKEVLEAAVQDALNRWNIDWKSVSAVASIDLKKEEDGLFSFAREYGLSFHTYPAERLMRAEGEFSSSSFVKEVTGVDNVCERAAVSLAEELGGGRLIMKKQAGSGVTVAAAVRDWKVKL